MLDTTGMTTKVWTVISLIYIESVLVMVSQALANELFATV